MKKKLLALLLVCLIPFSAVSCKKNETVAKYEGTLTELLDAIYEKAPTPLRLATTEIDLSDPMYVNNFLGLQSADGIAEAIASEPMMSSQAYSLCLVRTEEGADIDALRQSIFDNVDVRKWICVEANQLIVADSGDIILMIMMSSSIDETLCEGIYNAFV